jgi:hypothetical protein
MFDKLAHTFSMEYISFGKIVFQVSILYMYKQNHPSFYVLLHVALVPIPIIFKKKKKKKKKSYRNYINIWDEVGFLLIY